MSMQSRCKHFRFSSSFGTNSEALIDKKLTILADFWPKFAAQLIDQYCRYEAHISELEYSDLALQHSRISEKSEQVKIFRIFNNSGPQSTNIASILFKSIGIVDLSQAVRMPPARLRYAIYWRLGIGCEVFLFRKCRECVVCHFKSRKNDRSSVLDESQSKN